MGLETLDSLEGWRYQGVARPVNIFSVLVVPAADNLLEANVHGLTAMKLSAFSTLSCPLLTVEEYL